MTDCAEEHAGGCTVDTGGAAWCHLVDAYVCSGFGT